MQVIRRNFIEHMLCFLKQYYPLVEEPKITAFIVPEKKWNDFMTLCVKLKRCLEEALQQIQHSSLMDATHLKIQITKQGTHRISENENFNEFCALYFQSTIFTINEGTSFGDQIKPLIEILKETKYGIAIRGSLDSTHILFALVEELLHIIEIESNQRIFFDNLKVDAEIVNMYFREYMEKFLKH